MIKKTSDGSIIVGSTHASNTGLEALAEKYPNEASKLRAELESVKAKLNYAEQSIMTLQAQSIYLNNTEL